MAPLLHFRNKGQEFVFEYGSPEQPESIELKNVAGRHLICWKARAARISPGFEGSHGSGWAVSRGISRDRLSDIEAGFSVLRDREKNDGER